MCNTFHTSEEYQPKEIPSTGFAWKIFKPNGSGLFDSEYIQKGRVPADLRFWVAWNSKYYPRLCEDGVCGFCGFSTKKDALSLLRNLHREWRYTYDRCVIKKIQYDKGIGSILSKEIDHIPRRFILFKRFRLAKEKKK